MSDQTVTSDSLSVRPPLAWAIISTVLFWPVGLFAIVNAVRARRSVAAGDSATAAAASRRARRLALLATIVGAVTTTASIVGLVVVYNSILGGMQIEYRVQVDGPGQVQVNVTDRFGEHTEGWIYFDDEYSGTVLARPGAQVYLTVNAAGVDTTTETSCWMGVGSTTMTQNAAPYTSFCVVKIAE